VVLASDALGLHTITLMVTDADGLSACASTQHVVDVLEPKGLSVELWWETPGDPDPADTGLGTGTDLDLHLLHELAVGLDLSGDESFDGWFDKPFDVFWANPNPNWGVVGDPKAGDDPVLTYDDYDGTGPERIVLENPEPTRPYRVGVHHWDDHGHGPATAWVRVWWDGELVHEAGGVLLVEDVLWDVGTLEVGGGWSSPGVEPLVHTGVRKPVTLKAP